MARDITATIQTASDQRGHPIETHQLEGVVVVGTPFLSGPIPDNPLMPGIASIQEQCPPDAVPSKADWVYCPSSGVMRPVLGGQSVSGNE
jgi:hypothetical protein